MSERFNTLQELADYINNEGVSSFMDIQNWDFAHIGEGCEWYLEIDDETYTVTMVHESGGDEGGTQAAQSVFEVLGMERGKFLRVDYRYYSQNGYDFDCAECRVVGCREVMVKVYD